MDVLEHVNRQHMHEACKSWFRVLRPGGLFFTQVGLDDHLSHYDHGKGEKYYLGFSQTVNERLFNSTSIHQPAHRK